MKTVEDARYIRDSILSKFEMAEIATDPQERAEWLTFVVIGAGPTGVELAGQIAELAHTVLPRDYRSVDTKEARILLFEGAPVGAAAVPGEAAALHPASACEEMGVEIRVNTLAIDMDHESITVKGPDGVETIRARTRIWAAGVQASPLAKMLAEKAGVEADRAGRIPVNPDCSVPGHPEVFAIGDMVSLNKLPGIAQPALQEGKYVGKVIKARLAGQPVEPFKYFDKGTMATIGYRSAVANAFGVKLTGFLGYLTWAFIHIAYLVGWGNRIGAMYTWARGIWFGHSRAHRIITFESTNKDLTEGYLPSGRLPAILPMARTASAVAAAAGGATEAEAPAADTTVRAEPEPEAGERGDRGGGAGHDMPCGRAEPEDGGNGATEAEAPATDMASTGAEVIDPTGRAPPSRTGRARPSTARALQVAAHRSARLGPPSGLAHPWRSRTCRAGARARWSATPTGCVTTAYLVREHQRECVAAPLRRDRDRPHACLRSPPAAAELAAGLPRRPPGSRRARAGDGRWPTRR